MLSGTRISFVYMCTYVGVLTLEKSCLVELASDLSDFEDLFQLVVRNDILFVGPRGTVVISRQVRTQARNGP
jgi:hypothetical protein